MSLCTFEVEDGVAVISLNRPQQLNIVNVALRDELIESFLAARDHPDVAAVVLRANGKHFSAGADLSEFGSADTVFEARRIRWDRDPWGPLWDLPQPVVVALHGISLAAGLEMAMLCDIRLGGPDTVVGLPETKLGMLPAAGGTQSLTRAVGPRPSLAVVATAEQFDAGEALARGLLHRVCDDVEAEARAVADRWARLDRSVLRAAKAALHGAGDLPLAAGLARERRLAARTGVRRPPDGT
jgi:enoyl-CoA hydratase/carnithine racemase